jgi:hypothetical protein
MCGGCIWAGAVLLLHQAYGKASISYFIGMCSPVTFQHGNDGKRCPLAVKCAWKKNAYTFCPGSDRSVDWIMISGAGHDVGMQVILGEEVATSKMTLFDVTKQICDAIQARGEQGKYHGVILLPEGLIENIPEFYALLQEINSLLKQDVNVENISSHLSPWAAALFDFLPNFIKKQLLLDRESDGSVQLSQIETEKLLAQLVETEMTRRSV